MKVQGKVWGHTYALFNKNNVEVHYLTAKKGGYCSEHWHTKKYNKFIVIEGELKITVWNDGVEDVTLLAEGEELTVKPGLRHKFEALENSAALEIYWVELEEDDIIRETVGGMMGGFKEE